MNLKNCIFSFNLLALAVNIQSMQPDQLEQFAKETATKKLYNAVQSNSLDEARKALSTGKADPNCLDAKFGGYQYDTMLEKAVEHGNEPLVILLLEAKAKPNLKSRWGFSFPLDAAARLKNERLVTVLLEAGASPNAWQHKQIDSCSTVLPRPTIIAAAERENNEIILQKLLDAGADINAKEPRFEEYTALMAAALLGNILNVKFLLSKGARTDLLNRDKRTALALARLKGQQGVVQILEQHNPA